MVDRVAMRRKGSEVMNRISKILEPQNWDFLAVFFIRVFGAVSLAFVFLILLMGLLSTLVGVGEFFGIFVRPPYTTSQLQDIQKLAELPNEAKLLSTANWLQLTLGVPNFHMAISTLMSSLEFYLLAPLGYILLRTLGNYMAAVERQKSGHADADSIAALMSVKALTMGLLIAVLATHLVSLFLEHSDEGVFPTQKVYCGIALVAALIIYYWVIERSSQGDSEGSGSGSKSSGGNGGAEEIDSKTFRQSAADEPAPAQVSASSVALPPKMT